MKKRSLLLSFIFIFIFAALLSSASEKPQKEIKNMPDNVKAIVENSCYGCHNSDSKNEKAREELSFDKLNDLSKIKKIGTYKHIGETIEENEMPPKKFLERFPDKKLSDNDKKILLDWAKNEAQALVKE